MEKVAVPEEIINLLSDVRSFLQEKCEPPVYVSDRRLVKALALLQVPYPASACCTCKTSCQLRALSCCRDIDLSASMLPVVTADCAS